MKKYDLMRLSILALTAFPLGANMMGLKPDLLKPETLSKAELSELIINGLNGYAVPRIGREENRQDSPFSIGRETFFEQFTPSQGDNEKEYAIELSADIDTYLSKQKSQINSILFLVELLLAFLGGSIFLMTGDYNKKGDLF